MRRKSKIKAEQVGSPNLSDSPTHNPAIMSPHPPAFLNRQPAGSATTHLCIRGVPSCIHPSVHLDGFDVSQGQGKISFFRPLLYFSLLIQLSPYSPYRTSTHSAEPKSSWNCFYSNLPRIIYTRSKKKREDRKKMAAQTETPKKLRIVVGGDDGKFSLFSFVLPIPTVISRAPLHLNITNKQSSKEKSTYAIQDPQRNQKAKTNRNKFKNDSWLRIQDSPHETPQGTSFGRRSPRCRTTQRR